MKPALISADWGTTALRVYLVDASGTVLDRRQTAEGILVVQAGGFGDVLKRAAAGWLDEDGSLPVLLSGMVGSRQGWRETAYVRCPVDLHGLATELMPVPVEGLRSVHIIPGIHARDAVDRPDVIRGEETQVLGALALSGADAGLFVLPGTHSKWITIASGAVTGFRTYMTGEVFAALRDHTILGRLMQANAGSGRGFAQGLQAAREPGAPGALLNRICMARTLGLFDELPAEELADYLSGLLIGSELTAEAGAAGQGFTVIAAADLRRHYERAASLLGFAARAAPEDCVVAGHIALARAAGLVGAAR